MNSQKTNNFFSLENLTIQTLLRIFFIVLIFVFDFISMSKNDEFSLSIKISFVLITISLSVLILVLIRYYKRKVFLLYLQVFVDLISTTGIIFLIQQTNFLVIFLYLLSITNAAIILFRKGAFIAAISSSSLTIIVYKLMMNLEIIDIDFSNLLERSILNLIIYFSYAIIITILTESLVKKDLLLYEKEKELNAQKKIKNAIIDNMYSGVIAVDNSKEILYLNNNAELILNVKNDDYKGLCLNELLVTLEDFKIDNKQEIIFDDKVIGLTITKLKDIENHIDGFMIIFQDITEKLRFEEAIKRNEKLAYIGEISASIAHEIRNPLASISASLQMIPRFINKDSIKIEKLASIGLKEITRLNSLITDFLDYARIDKLENKDIDLLSILMELKKLYELDSVKYLIIKNNDLEEIKINGDEDKLRQVFINIIKNSIEAMEDIEDKEILIDCKYNDKEYIISIKDKGYGISDDILQKVFNPFFTTKKAGTGIGLSLINKFISLHKGRIDVNSKVGEGTEFILYIPKLNL